MSTEIKNKNKENEIISECETSVSRSSVVSDTVLKKGPWVHLGSRCNSPSDKMVSDLEVMEVAAESVPKRKAEKSPSVSPREPEEDKKKKKKRASSRPRKVKGRIDDESDTSDIECVSSPPDLSENASRRSNRVLGLSPPLDPRDAIERCPSPSKLEDHSAADLWVVVKDLLDHVDQRRVVSKNIKGSLSKEMKTGIDLAKAVVKNLFHRLQDQGDRTLLRHENLVLRDQVDDMRRKDEEKEGELKFLKEKISILTREMGLLRKTIDKVQNTYPVVESDSSNVDAQFGPPVASTSSAAPLPQRVPRMVRPLGPPPAASVRMMGHPESEKRGNYKINVDDTSDNDLINAEQIYRQVEIYNRGKPVEKRVSNPFKSNLMPRSPSPPPKVERRGRKPKIIKDVQLVPPSLTPALQSEGVSTPVSTGVENMDWQPVTRRRRSQRGKLPFEKAIVREMRPSSYVEDVNTAGNLSSRYNIARNRVYSAAKNRPLKTAAVTIKGVTEDCSYASALTKAKQNIPLAEMGLEQSKFRRTINGGRIIEIPGPDAADKADKLAQHLRVVLGDAYEINRPVIRGEIRILGLDDSTTPEDVSSVISELGGCSMHQIKVGSIRMLNNGLGSIWAQCPLAAAVKIAAKQKIRIGWSLARVIFVREKTTAVLQVLAIWPH